MILITLHAHKITPVKGLIKAKLIIIILNFTKISKTLNRTEQKDTMATLSVFQWKTKEVCLNTSDSRYTFLSR